MSSEATSSTPVKERNSDVLNNRMLALIVKQVSDKDLNWDQIAGEMPTDKNGKATTIPAIKERWRRYKISHGLATVKSAEPGSSKKPAAKGKITKRKSEGDDTGEDEIKDDTPKKKKKSKTPVKANDSDGDVSEQTPVKPKIKKSVVAKKTPKKTAPAKSNEKASKSADDEELSENDGGKEVDTKMDDAISVESEKAESVKHEAMDEEMDA